MLTKNYEQAIRSVAQPYLESGEIMMIGLIDNTVIDRENIFEISEVETQKHSTMNYIAQIFSKNAPEDLQKRDMINLVQVRVLKSLVDSMEKNDSYANTIYGTKWNQSLFGLGQDRLLHLFHDKKKNAPDYREVAGRIDKAVTEMESYFRKQ